MIRPEMISVDSAKYVPQEIPLDRVLALVNLINECDKAQIKISSVIYYNHGFSVTFEGLPGDAILHDGSRGKSMCMWETMEMPWDGADVTPLYCEELIEHIKNEKKKKEELISWNLL